MSLLSVWKNRVVVPSKKFAFLVSNGDFKLGLNSFCSLSFRGTDFAKSAEKKYQRLLIEKLKSEFSHITEKYKQYGSVNQYNPNAPIWVCWFQGIENAPYLVKKCVESIRNSTSHPVNIISSDNMCDYVKFPSYIIEKYKSGMITNAQMSDIVRMALLSEYGGLWIDATIFVPNKISEDIFKQEFYTCKRKKNDASLYVSENRWTSFMNGCQYGCVVQKAMCELFYEYWKNNTSLVDYLLVDYFMCVVYEEIPYARKLIDELEYNNSKIEDLQEAMGDEFDEARYKKIIKPEDTYFYKLSWRMDFPEFTADKKPTFFKMFMEDKI